ncbi:MAG: FAD-dependent oxidoreductase, partial [Candidatus Eutrophobiaceae bacterium]
MSSDCDLFVIGAGSGGVRAARRAAASGMRVALAERGAFGGTCVNVGCVPKKLLWHAAHHVHELRMAQDFAWDSVGHIHWPALIAAKDRAILRLNGIYTQLLESAGVRIVHGDARLNDAHTVVVGGKSFHAERILIATGGHPHIPALPGGEAILDSDGVFHLPELPQRMVIVGAGYIALEFAGIFHALGVETTLICRGARLLRGFDAETAAILAEELVLSGLRILYEEEVVAVARQEGELRVQLKSGNTLYTNELLFATGRRPNTHGIGLEEAGVELSADGRIRVDRNFCSTAPSVYAIGDVSSDYALTPVAIAEAEALVRHWKDGAPTELERDLIPTCVYSQPPLASVGMSQEQAENAFPGEIAVRSSRFRPLKHSLGESQQRCFMKLVFNRVSQRVLGIHLIADEAAEIIQGFAVAMCNGLDC